jgi:hypothetical protein
MSAIPNMNTSNTSNYSNIVDYYLSKQQANQATASEFTAYLKEEETKRPDVSEKLRVISQGKVLENDIAFHIPTLLELVSEEIVTEDTPYLDWIFSTRDSSTFLQLEPVERDSRWKSLIKYLAGYRKKPSHVPAQELYWPIFTVYPPPPDGTATLTNIEEKISNKKAALKIGLMKIGGGYLYEFREEREFPANQNNPQMWSIKMSYSVEHWYNILTRKHAYIPRLDPPSFGGFQREDAPTVVPVPVNKGGEWVEMQELLSKKSKSTLPESWKLEVKEKTHWNMGISIGKDLLEYSYEMENSHVFSIKLTFPAGHNYMVWRKKKEWPLTPVIAPM